MIGQTISHYTITEKLGEGGMGVVYKAEDTKLERTVALKFLASHLMANEEASKRFIREAKAAAALDHPNICTVHEIDEVDDHTFIAMAYLEGETLDKRIAAGPVPLDDALDIAIQIARGLEAASSQEHLPSRHQTGQRHAPRPGLRAAHQDHGLRARATRRALAAHRSRHDSRHDGLYVARANRRRRYRPAHRPVGVGLRAVRDNLGTVAVPR